MTSSEKTALRDWLRYVRGEVRARTAPVLAAALRALPSDTPDAQKLRGRAIYHAQAAQEHGQPYELLLALDALDDAQAVSRSDAGTPAAPPTPASER